MKKILPILLTLFLFFACYFIYNKTEKKNKNYLFIGDRLLNNKYLQKMGNSCFVNDDYRVIDLLNILKYNEEKKCGNDLISLHLLLNKADILTVSIGYNDILSNLSDEKKLFYTEISEMIKNIDSLLNIISKYDYDKVLFLGYYNFTESSDDYILYLNYNIKKVLKKYNYEFIDLSSLNDQVLFFNNNYLLNNDGYLQLYKILVEKYKKY